MYRIIAASLALALVACDARTASTTTGQQALVSAYMKCLRRTARRLDDRRSEASVIGAAVAQECSAAHAVAPAAPGPQEISTATMIVLDQRNKNPN